MGNKELAFCFKVLGDETRCKIVDMLKTNELCASQILEKFNISQPTLSYHMKMLTDSKIVTAEKRGVWCIYSINFDVLAQLTQFIERKSINSKAG